MFDNKDYSQEKVKRWPEESESNITVEKNVCLTVFVPNPVTRQPWELPSLPLTFRSCSSEFTRIRAVPRKGAFSLSLGADGLRELKNAVT